MEKKTVLVPVYENKAVQTGTREVTTWTTSSGNTFHNEYDAERHEFHWRVRGKFPSINLHYDPDTMEFQSEEDAKRFKNDWHYDYDFSTLTYPCKVVYYSYYEQCKCNSDEDREYCRCHDDSVEVIVPFEEYRSMMLKHIESL